MAVVDASVILSSILPDDPHHQASRDWISSLIQAGNHFTAPTLLLSEIAAPLGRAYGQPELARRIVQTLATASFAVLTPISTSLAIRAALIAAEYRIRGCDAVYVALAESIGEDLITLDEQQGQRAGAVVATRPPW